ncbi:PcfJ domain-containing protein [Halopseudomonas xiamenensis]|uniref:PcfJ domain-containing protein n=1 Tax=Halopseudomonas xiamenensis TaxID=157792 RepID=UPI00162AEF4C|nr:PcfJ domain-containing protein [Halopseudomonas xiamenensis]
MYCIDFTTQVGYPLTLHINAPEHELPLFWQTRDEYGKVVGDGGFLQPPGLPLQLLLSSTAWTQIPQAALDIARAVPLKQFQLLQSMLVSQAAMELALSAPFLFLLVVDHAEQQQWPLEYFKMTVMQKRTLILRKLDLPARPAVARLLARATLEFRFHPDFRHIPVVLRNHRHLSTLLHIQHPNMQQFLFLALYDGYSWPGLLNLIGPQTGVWEMAHLRKLLNICLATQIPLGHFRKIQSLSDLQILYARMQPQIKRRRRLKSAVDCQQVLGDFPTPPFPGNHIVQPLVSWVEFIQEGQEMQHCVVRYASYVAGKRYFIYRYYGKQRLTVSIKSTSGGWRLNQVRGVDNRIPDETSMRQVQDWFEHAQSHTYLPDW